MQSTASALAERVRDDILEGVFEAGKPLPQEEIAARYGVSRSPLREALRQLESEGWIVYRPNRGAFVATIGAADVREIYQVRKLLEAGAVRLAVPNVDAACLDTLRAIAGAENKAKDTREALTLHMRFHQTLYFLAGNPRLNDAILRHYVRVQRLPNVARRVAAVMRVSRADHQAIIEACERGDVRAAERATLAHLDHLEAIMLEGLE